MSRRGGTVQIRCHTENCRETTLVAYDLQRERREIATSSYYQNWKCARHAKPERYLTPDNTANSVVLVATEKFYAGLRGEQKSLGLFWVPEGKDTGSGYNFSEAHVAEAKNFPAGTRLVITAYVETPEQAEISRAVWAAEDGAR